MYEITRLKGIDQKSNPTKNNAVYGSIVRKKDAEVNDCHISHFYTISLLSLDLAK